MIGVTMSKTISKPAPSKTKTKPAKQARSKPTIVGSVRIDSHRDLKGTVTIVSPSKRTKAELREAANQVESEEAATARLRAKAIREQLLREAQPSNAVVTIRYDGMERSSPGFEIVDLSVDSPHDGYMARSKIADALRDLASIIIGTHSTGRQPRGAQIVVLLK